MTKLYYYDCSIEAAYMAKNFGVKFRSAGGAALVYCWGCRFAPESMPCAVFEGEYYYITPESLALLDPKKGDLFLGSGRLLQEGEQPEPIKTIQRDGKPFIWPLSS